MRSESISPTESTATWRETGCQAVPPCDGDRGRVGLLVHRDAVGERGEVLVLPGQVPASACTERGAGRPSAQERCISQAMSSAVHGTPSSPGPETSASTCAISVSSAVSSAFAAEGRIRCSSGDADSSQRSTTERPETSTPRNTSLSAIDRPMRWCCSPVRKSSHPSAPPTSGRRPGELRSKASAQRATGKRTTGHPQVAPAALQLAELVGDAADERLALGVRPEAPGLRGEPVPGGDRRRGARDVAVDGAQRDGRAVGGGRRRPREGPAAAPARRSGAQRAGAGVVVVLPALAVRRVAARRGPASPKAAEQVVVGRPARRRRRRARSGARRGRPRPASTADQPGKEPHARGARPRSGSRGLRPGRAASPAGLRAAPAQHRRPPRRVGVASRPSPGRVAAPRAVAPGAGGRADCAGAGGGRPSGRSARRAVTRSTPLVVPGPSPSRRSGRGAAGGGGGPAAAGRPRPARPPSRAPGLRGRRRAARRGPGARGRSRSGTASAPCGSVRPAGSARRGRAASIWTWPVPTVLPSPRVRRRGPRSSWKKRVSHSSSGRSSSMRLATKRTTTTVMSSAHATEKKPMGMPRRRWKNITTIMTMRPTP